MSTRTHRILCMAAVVVLLLVGQAWAEPVNVLAGAVWRFSADRGKTFTATDSPTIPPGQKQEVCAEARFEVADPSAFVGGRLIPSAFDGRVELNGKAIQGPLEEMIYQAIPFDTRPVLAKGPNVVVFKGAVRNGGAEPMSAQASPSLELYSAGDVKIQTGPILGAIGEDFFTVTCRTNVPATVKVKAVPAGSSDTRPVTADSPQGLYHRLRISLPQGAKTFRYTVTANAGAGDHAAGPFTVRVPAADGTLRFVVAGDNRSYPKRWAQVLAGIRKAQPDLMFNTGDLVSSGPKDALWDTEFFGPAREVLQTVPTYAVLGNHDQGAKVFFELIYAPGPTGKERNWSQTIDGVQFIGVDGAGRGGATPEWVDSQLTGSKAKFIFFFTHYPAWSSGPHGDNGGSIKLMPVLAKHRVTAMFAGHDHTYERLEPPADVGIPCIVTGGGGAPTYQLKKRSPHSKIFYAGLHFCAVQIKGDTCQMRVLDASGKQLDEKTFLARTVDSQ